MRDKIEIIYCVALITIAIIIGAVYFYTAYQCENAGGLSVRNAITGWPTCISDNQEKK